MDLTRRDAIQLSAAALAIGAVPLTALAENNGYQEVVDAFTGGADAPDAGIELRAPEIAENGSSVAVSVTARGAEAITLISTGNPNPEIATFHFGALATATAGTKIRLARSQDVLAVARMKDGTFRRTSVAVTVTVGGCG